MNVSKDVFKDVLPTYKELRARGIKVEVIGNNLRLTPKSKLTPDLITKVKRYKEELINILQSKPPQEPCYACGDYNWWLSIHNIWVCGTCHPPACRELVKYTVSKDLKCLDEVVH